MASADESSEPHIRDRLALTRTRLANERTLLAYVRTAIMLAVTGATLLKFFHDEFPAVVSGWALLTIAVTVGLIGAKRFRTLGRELD